MKVEYINPFIESVHDLFSTMLGSQVSRRDVSVVRDDIMSPVMGLIGMSGPARGTVALAFPVETVFKMVGALIGEEPTSLDEETVDAVAEVVNIVAGGAKAKLGSAATGKPIDLGLPTVVCGEKFNVLHPTDSVWLEVAFDSDLGPFSLRVTFEFDN